MASGPPVPGPDGSPANGESLVRSHSQRFRTLHRSPKGEPESPDQLERKLEFAVGGRGAADCVEQAEGRRRWRRSRRGWRWGGLVHERVGHGKDGVIQQVEGLKPELEFELLGNGGGLHGAEVETHVLWTAQDAAAGITENFQVRRSRHGRRVPPVQELFGAIIRISGDVAVVLLEVDVADGPIAPGEARNRETRAHGADTANLPAGEHLLNRAGPA